MSFASKIRKFNRLPVGKKLIYAGLGGAGLAQAENHFLLRDYLPDELKKINLGVGATTGIAAALGGKTALTAALLSLPLKQMALLGIGSMEKNREQQRELAGLNLDRAKVDLATARAKNPGLTTMLEAIAALSLAGAAGAGGYYAYNQRKKPRPPKSADPSAQKGSTNGGRNKLRIRIDVPAKSAPEELLQSLVNLDDNTNAKTEYTLKKAFYNVLSR